MIIHLACDLSRVGYRKDQYWSSFVSSLHQYYDICNVSNLLKFVLFADDTNIFCSSTSLHDLRDTINSELGKLFVWFSVNRLSLNLGEKLHVVPQ